VAQHFLVSKKCRDLTAHAIHKMTDDQVLEFLKEARWGTTEKQGCPLCGAFARHKYRKHRKQWRCKDCDYEFSVTSMTVFADRKITLYQLLLAIWLFMSSPNGISAPFLASNLGVQPKTAFVLLGKLREVVLRAMDRNPMSGELEIDGGHFGGKPRRPNVRRKSDPKLIAEAIESGRLTGRAGTKRKTGITRLNLKKLGNRRIAIVMRQRSRTPKEGAIRTFVWIGKAETAPFITEVVHRHAKLGSLIISDEGRGFLPLKDRYDTSVVAHSQMYCTPEGVNQNQAESFMSRLRRVEWVYHGFHSPTYQADYAAYAARLEDDRRIPLRQRTLGLARDAMNGGFSAWWRGYWQGKRRVHEVLCDNVPAALCIPRQQASFRTIACWVRSMRPCCASARRR
jgi:transposase-like protein